MYNDKNIAKLIYLTVNIVNSTLAALQVYDPTRFLKQAILNYMDDESEEDSWTKVMRQVQKWRKQSRKIKKAPTEN